MTLLEWVKKELENGIELWNDEKYITNSKGITVKRDVHRNRNICLGIISSNSPEEWYRIVRLNCPPGTIINEYNEEEWSELYLDQLSIIRNELVKLLLVERANKSAKTLLDILERRDQEHWMQKTQTKTAEVKTGNETITFRFEGI